MKRKIYQALATFIDARANCERSGNIEWHARHEERAEAIVADGPSGSGIDNGTRIDWERSTGDKIVLTFGFHHMDEHGYYDGWNDYQAVVTPSLIHGIQVTIKGRNRNDIKSYLFDVYHTWLTSEYSESK